MNKILVVRAFEKARIKKKKEGIKNPSHRDLSEELSNYIDEKGGFKLGERSFRDYHNDAKKLLGKNIEEDLSIKQLSVINGLCDYLGFDNYQEFLESIERNREKPKIDRVKILMKKNKAVISLMLVLIIGFIIYNSATRQRWMIWQQNHYVEVKFDAEEYSISQLKIYNEDRVKYFRKVIVTCDTVFFNKDKSVRFWYGKNKDKELEYFTALGLHPETGKTLKPISQYMIDNHICIVSPKTPQ